MLPMSSCTGALLFFPEIFWEFFNDKRNAFDTRCSFFFGIPRVNLTPLNGWASFAKGESLTCPFFAASEGGAWAASCWLSFGRRTTEMWMGEV